MSTQTQPYFTYIFSMITSKGVCDISSAQALLTEIVTKGINDPVGLVNDIYVALKESKKKIPKDETADKASRRVQVFYLFFSSLIFNIYSKIKTTSELVKLQNSMYSSSNSLSLSQTLDLSQNSIEKTKFVTFFKNFLQKSEIYTELLESIPSNLPEKYIPQVSTQIKHFVSTIDYILLRENDSIDSQLFQTERLKFQGFLQLAESEPEIKKYMKYMNKIIFGGDIKKLLKMIGHKNNKTSNHVSLIRILQYYHKDVTGKKYFDEGCKSGNEIMKKIIFSYLRTKVEFGKELLFTETRESEPIVDFLLSYLGFNFFTVIGHFGEYHRSCLQDLDKLKAQEFYQAFEGDIANSGCKIIEGLPDELKGFLRDLNLMIIKAQFKDNNLSTLYPVKKLFLRFLLTTKVQGASGYFRDLFFDDSLTKYSHIPNFKKLHEQFNTSFQKMLIPSKGSNRIGSTFFVTKPLIRYDYSILLELCNELGIDDNVEFDFFFDSTNLDGMDIQIKDALNKQPTSKSQYSKKPEESKSESQNVVPKELKDDGKKTSEEAPSKQGINLQQGLGNLLLKKRESEHSQTQEKKPEPKPDPKAEPKADSRREERPGSRGSESGFSSTSANPIPKTIAGFQDTSTNKPGNKKLAKHLTLDPSMDSGEFEENLQELGIQAIAEQPATIVEDNKDLISSTRSDQQKGLFKGIKKDQPQAEPTRENKNIQVTKSDPKPVQKQDPKPVVEKPINVPEVKKTTSTSSNAAKQKQSEPKRETAKSTNQIPEEVPKKVESIAPNANKTYQKSNTSITKSKSDNEQEAKPIERKEPRAVQVVQEKILVPDVNPDLFIDKDTYQRKIRELEIQQENEKAKMINKINIIEEKYTLVLDMVTTMAAEKNVERERQSILDDARYTSYIQGNEDSHVEKNISPQKNMADDEFYQLNSEIERAREEAFKAELEYVMYKKLNFFEGDEGKRITY